MTIINSDTAKHSPLPFKTPVKLLMQNMTKFLYIVDADGDIVIEENPYKDNRSKAERLDKLNKLNAVVRACNAFEPMREALKAWFEWNKLEDKRPVWGDNPDASLRYQDKCFAACDKFQELAKSALALAEKGE